MADEETEQTPEDEAPAEATEPVAEAEAEADAGEEAELVEGDAPAAEAEPAEEAAPAEEPVAAEEPAPPEEPPAAEEPAPPDEADGPPPPEAQAEVAPEPAAAVSPKELRRRRRSTHTGEARPQRSPEERQADRQERRRSRAATRRAYRVRARTKARERAAAAPAVDQSELAAPASTGRPKVRQGVVTSDRADKTITVRIDAVRRHRRYGKVIRSSSTLHAHDASNDARQGDTVRVVESRPLSKTKRWKLVEVLERAR